MIEGENRPQLTKEQKRLRTALIVLSVAVILACAKPHPNPTSTSPPKEAPPPTATYVIPEEPPPPPPPPPAPPRATGEISAEVLPQSTGVVVFP